MYYNTNDKTRYWSSIGIRRRTGVLSDIAKKTICKGLNREDVISPMTGVVKELEMALNKLKNEQAIYDYKITYQMQGIEICDLVVIFMFTEQMLPHEVVGVNFKIDVENHELILPRDDIKISNDFNGVYSF